MSFNQCRVYNAAAAVATSGHQKIWHISHIDERQDVKTLVKHSCAVCAVPGHMDAPKIGLKPVFTPFDAVNMRNKVEGDFFGLAVFCFS